MNYIGLVWGVIRNKSGAGVICDNSSDKVNIEGRLPDGQEILQLY